MLDEFTRRMTDTGRDDLAKLALERKRALLAEINGAVLDKFLEEELTIEQQGT